MLHVPTVLVIASTLAATYGSILLYLWLQHRRQLAMVSWSAAHFIAAVSLALMPMRGMVPDIVAVQLANAGMALAYGLIWAGARQFGGGQARVLPTLAGILGWLAACQFPAFSESLSARILALGMIAAVYHLAAAWEFHRDGPCKALRSRRLIIGILLANAAAYLLRIPGLLLRPLQPSPMDLPVSPFVDAFLLVGIAAGGSLVLGLVALQREMEEREANAALREARDAADRASAEKSRFLAHMSHELRTPLNGVLGFAQILKEDPALPPLQREHAAMLERTGRHLNALLNDVLDLSSIEAGRLRLLATPTALVPLMEDVVGLSRAAAEAKRVRLFFEPARDLPAGVLCDALRVRQILHNLLNNAVKFTPPGGQVVFSVHRRDAGGLVLSVRDDGPGIPRDFHYRLFQDYARASQVAGRSEGTGLGLAISAGLAQAMDGSIRFGTPPDGRGSIFEVWLPLPDAEPPASPAEAPAPGSASLQVLVVDDVAVNRLVLRGLLQGAGHRVTEAEDGQAALGILTGAPSLPDAVLMDVLMPGMDGLEATRRIRALPGPASRLRILAVTAGAMPEQIAACLEAGMNGHLVKPVDRQVLLAALARREHARA
ncbi:response regulator [Roseomonas sp. SSH11]|uniref:histidine kinase n=1 Tax=Pararoseomonas baculiformis TaxID=2820812 RepID=A0ABS4ACN5_9PROT|nr:ATP-binding protein [Pararoseomonas baculiformis]MBP0444770.1 response regulator [Pararoseomonas baculiformis]